MLETTTTAAPEPADLTINPQTLSQVRVLWKQEFPGDEQITCSRLFEICQLTTRIGAYAFSPDSNVLAVAVCLGERTETALPEEPFRWGCTGASVVTLYDSATGDELASLSTASLPISLAFHPDGQILAAGLANSDIELWDVSTSELTATLGRTGFTFFGVGSVQFTPDGNVLVSGSGPGVQLWDWRSAIVLDLIADSFLEDGISPDGRNLMTTYYVGPTSYSHRLYDLSDLSRFVEIRTNGDTALTLFSFHPSNGLIAISGDGAVGMVSFWNPTGDASVSTLFFNRDLQTVGVNYGLNAGGFTPGGYFLIERSGLLTGLDEGLRACGFALLDVEANKIFHLPGMTAEECFSPERIVHFSAEIRQVISPDGRFVAGDDGFDGVLRVWGVDLSQPAIVPECFGSC